MPFFKFLGVTAPEPDETETIHRLTRQMEGLDPQVARYHALFACVLCRVARSDLKISEAEVGAMEKILIEIGHLMPVMAAFVVEIAKVQSELLGGIEGYLFTREFSKLASQDQRVHLLECLFALAASENHIDTRENAEIRKIADELSIERRDFIAIRSRFREDLGVLKE